MNPSTPVRSVPSRGSTLGAEGSELAWLVLLGAIWGSAFPVIRFGIDAGVSPLPLGAARFGLAAALMAVFSLRRSGPWPSGRRLLQLALFGGVVFVGGYAACLNLGEQSISAGLSAVLVGTLPLWTVLFGLLLVRDEPVSRWAAAGIGCGFSGLLVLFLPNVFEGFTSFTVGELWVVGAAVLAAVGTLLIRRFAPGTPGTRGLTVEFAVAAGMLAVLSFVPGAGRSLPWNENALLSIVYLAVLPSGIGFAIYFELLRRVGALGANLVSYVNPLAGVVLGVLLLHEGVSAVEVAGFLLVVTGLALFQWDRSRRLPDR